MVWTSKQSGRSRGRQGGACAGPAFPSKLFPLLHTESPPPSPGVPGLPLSRRVNREHRLNPVPGCQTLSRSGPPGAWVWTSAIPAPSLAQRRCYFHQGTRCRGQGGGMSVEGCTGVTVPSSQFPVPTTSIQPVFSPLQGAKLQPQATLSVDSLSGEIGDCRHHWWELCYLQRDESRTLAGLACRPLIATLMSTRLWRLSCLEMRRGPPTDTMEAWTGSCSQAISSLLVVANREERLKMSSARESRCSPCRVWVLTR